MFQDFWKCLKAYQGEPPISKKRIIVNDIEKNKIYKTLTKKFTKQFSSFVKEKHVEDDT